MIYYTAQAHEEGPDSIIIYTMEPNGDTGFGEVERDDPRLPEFVKDLKAGQTVDENGNSVESVP